MERETGFEPATSTLARSHSTTELLPPSDEAIICNAAGAGQSEHLLRPHADTCGTHERNHQRRHTRNPLHRHVMRE
jgi:hypothetical protein